MGFSVEESPLKNKGKHNLDRLDLELLAIGKRTGLSFAEMNEFRSSDLLAYADIYTGSKKDKPRKATQKDIDKFFA